LRARQPRKIYLTGCGDSYAVMLAVRSLFEEMFGVPCEAVQALELAYYNNRAIDETSLVIGLSATGMTPRTVEALLVGKSRGARTIALTNVETSSLATNADHTLIVQAARKGWPTQASTAAIGLLCALAVRFGEASGEERKARAAEIMLQLDSLPTLIDQAVITHEASARALAKQLANRHFFLFSGGGPAFASAFFGAAKVKECTVDHAEAVSVEEYHHYHSLKTGEPLFLIVPKGKARNRAVEAALQGRRAGGRVFAVAPNDLLGETTELTFTMPDCDETIASALYTIPLQLFSYHLAIEKFRLAGGPK
jgi:glucosamine--fructose-6-phosphate aminotransferase (isomerizing)